METWNQADQVQNVCLSQKLYAMSWEIRGQAHLASFEMRDPGIENETLTAGNENCNGQKRILQTTETVFLAIRVQRRSGNPKNNFTPVHTEIYSATVVQVLRLGYSHWQSRAHHSSWTLLDY